jgi:hypothetical protein
MWRPPPFAVTIAGMDTEWGHTASWSFQDGSKGDA